MPAYLQMGHHSTNLLAAPLDSQFGGIVLSPVNEPKESIRTFISTVANGIDAIFDPQLFVPSHGIGELPSWDYFPTAGGSSDFSDMMWWKAKSDEILREVQDIGVKSIASPVALARLYTDDYYSSVIEVGDHLFHTASEHGIRTFLTLIVETKDLASYERVLEIASIATRAKSEYVYLLLVTDTEVGKELQTVDEIKGAMLLISLLKTYGRKVLVGCSSQDAILWKHAGAWSCATGKFLNLRRFTPDRFGDVESGGTQRPYWYEESLLTRLTEADLVRLQRYGLISENHVHNPFSLKIVESLQAGTGTPWIALGWRQYLYQFTEMIQKIERGDLDCVNAVENADEKWGRIQDHSPKIIFDQRWNTGQWVRSWLQAIYEFKLPW